MLLGRGGTWTRRQVPTSSVKGHPGLPHWSALKGLTFATWLVDGTWDNKTPSLNLSSVFSLKCAKQVKLWGNQQGSHRVSPLARELVLSRIGHPGLIPVGRRRCWDEVAGEAGSVGSWDGEHCRHRITWHGRDGWGRLGQHPVGWPWHRLGKLGNGRTLALGEGGCRG